MLQDDLKFFKCFQRLMKTFQESTYKGVWQANCIAACKLLIHLNKLTLVTLQQKTLNRSNNHSILPWSILFIMCRVTRDLEPLRQCRTQCRLTPSDTPNHHIITPQAILATPTSLHWISLETHQAGENRQTPDIYAGIEIRSPKPGAARGHWQQATVPPKISTVFLCRLSKQLRMWNQLNI